MRADKTMCSEVTSIKDEQTEQDSDSVASEQRRSYPVEFSECGVRQSIEDLRAEFGRELRAQQETILQAVAALESSRTSTRGSESEQTRMPVSMEVGQCTPVVNALVDAASEQKMQSHNGLSGVQTPRVFI